MEYSEGSMGLRKVQELFADQGFDYWVDSGALLGLIRDGRELAWDGDIDLGVWDSDLGEVKRLIMDLRTRGYFSAVHRYRGRIYEFTLLDRKRQAFRPVHIHV